VKKSEKSEKSVKKCVNSVIAGLKLEWGLGFGLPPRKSHALSNTQCENEHQALLMWSNKGTFESFSFRNLLYLTISATVWGEWMTNNNKFGSF